MIVSKANLKVVETTRVDSKMPALDNIHIAADGSSVGVGGKMLLAVSPVHADVKKKLSNVLDESGTGEAMTISSETVKSILKRFGADRKFGGLLDHCNIESIGKGECRIVMTDGKRTDKLIGKLYHREYVMYKNMVKVAMETVAGKGDGKRIVLNLKRLLLLLNTIDKIAPDSSGDSPVWIEFTPSNYIIIRGLNKVNGQRFMGVMSSYEGIEGKWLDPDSWELSFLKDESVKSEIVVKHKKVLKKKLVFKKH